MEKVNIKNYPHEYTYYRSLSSEYAQYLEKDGLKILHANVHRFGWLKKVLGGLFWVAKFERIDEEPDVEMIKKNGFTHGIIIWIPCKTQKIPLGWKKLWVHSGFTTTGVAIIEGGEYFKKWKERARRARKKFLNNAHLSIKNVSTQSFQDYYLQLDFKQPFKTAFRRYHKALSAHDKGGKIQNLICYYDETPIAGLAVMHYHENASVHLVSFITSQGKQYQAGTGLIDAWFQDALKHGIKYIHFDHLRDKYMTRDQQGYTDFKENFMDYKVVFEDEYFKIL